MQHAALVGKTKMFVVVEAIDASGCSPVRLTPVVGVTTGAHYRMSTGHSSPAQIENLRGPHIK